MRTPVAAAGGTIVYAVGKRLAVCGLAWDVLQQRDTKSRASELSAIGKRRNSRDAVVLQTTSGRAVVGFVPGDAPAKARQGLSAAAWLAASVDNPLVYIEQVGNDRWWYVVVRPGEVDISTDRIASGVDAAAALDDMLGEAVRESDWSNTQVVVSGTPPPLRLIEQNVITPLQGEFADFADASRASDPRAQIKRVTGGVSPLLLIAVIALGGMVILGGGWYVRKLLQDRAELAAAQAAAAANQRSAAELATLNDKRIQDAVTNALAADTATPVPSAFVTQCVNAYLATPLYAGGWARTEITCEAGGVSSRWLRHRGDLSDNQGLASAVSGWGGAPAVDGTGTSAQVSLPFAALSSRAPLLPDTLPAQTLLTLGFGSWIQRVEHDAKASATLTPPAVKPLQYMDPRVQGGKNGLSPVPPEKLYRTATFKLTGRGLAGLAMVHFDQPYLSFTSLRLTEGAGMDLDWILEGMYVLANH